MPVPPILEVFVVWHPDDDLGEDVARTLAEHFQGPAYAGLAGGAVEVYTRSAGWDGPGEAPRPLPFMSPLPAGLPAAQVTAVIPLLGTGLARAVRDSRSWRDYIKAIFAADEERIRGERGPARRAVFPLPDPNADLSGSQLMDLVRRPQMLALDSLDGGPLLCREVAQAITQRLSGDRMTVFISHTKHHSAEEQEDGPRLLDAVRDVLRRTRLGEFFDAADLQVGSDWAAHLDVEAGRSALLMVRTDLYSGREWTQREVLTAKRHDLPVVVLYALRRGEDRGSFLMDHVPAVPCFPDDPNEAIERALNRLVDESLKRALWNEQTVYLRSHGFDWLPAHSPEPITFTGWLGEHRPTRHNASAQISILHPDPPLGPREHDVIAELCALAGYTGQMDILTPRTFAARGGQVRS